MKYPNQVISFGHQGKKVVSAIQKQLVIRGIAGVSQTGVFDAATRSAVKLFQSMHRDFSGAPLVADGIVGPVTWQVLFGNDVTTTPVVNHYLTEVLKVALSQVGVMEVPEGSNRGPMVDAYLAATATPPGNYWCAAFVFWCFREAAENLGRKNPLVKTPGCLFHWNNTKGKKILAKEALQKPSLIKPGNIFIVDHGSGKGHTGIVESVHGGFISTIEGNSNPDGSNNGIGVFHLNNRKINSVNKGFIVYK